MFLPHGYEGQGPEHSSARLERYLQLCAEHNMQVCVPSTPAQIFHLLRRQMLRPLRKPLIVMTPKTLLRKKEAASPLGELANGRVPGDRSRRSRSSTPKKVRRIVFCAARSTTTCCGARASAASTTSPIVRIEQLYPFPHEEFAARDQALPERDTSVVWCQEEPQNQGAWYQIRHYLQRICGRTRRCLYAGRAVAAARRAVGYLQLHNEQQKALVEAAFDAVEDRPQLRAYASRLTDNTRRGADARIRKSS